MNSILSGPTHHLNSVVSATSILLLLGLLAYLIALSVRWVRFP